MLQRTRRTLTSLCLSRILSSLYWKLSFCLPMCNKLTILRLPIRTQSRLSKSSTKLCTAFLARPQSPRNSHNTLKRISLSLSLKILSVCMVRSLSIELINTVVKMISGNYFIFARHTLFIITSKELQFRAICVTHKADT